MTAYVSSVEAVIRDGIELCDYRLYNYSLLVMPKGQCFPACQRLDLPLTAPGTWGIVHWEGLPVKGDPAAIRAVTRRAGVIWKDCSGDAGASPRRATQGTREGAAHSRPRTAGRRRSRRSG